MDMSTVPAEMLIQQRGAVVLTNGYMLEGYIRLGTVVQCR